MVEESLFYASLNLQWHFRKLSPEEQVKFERYIACLASVERQTKKFGVWGKVPSSMFNNCISSIPNEKFEEVLC